MPIQLVSEVVDMFPIHKLYVGLPGSDSLPSTSRTDVLSLVANHFDSFTASDAIGFFKGKSIDTLIITIAHDDCERVRSLAESLRVHCRQKGVGIEQNGFYSRITAPTSKKREK